MFFSYVVVRIQADDKALVESNLPFYREDFQLLAREDGMTLPRPGLTAYIHTYLS
jgi:hypothetical protein